MLTLEIQVFLINLVVLIAAREYGNCFLKAKASLEQDRFKKIHSVLSKTRGATLIILALSGLAIPYTAIKAILSLG